MNKQLLQVARRCSIPPCHPGIILSTYLLKYGEHPSKITEDYTNSMSYIDEVPLKTFIYTFYSTRRCEKDDVPGTMGLFHLPTGFLGLSSQPDQMGVMVGWYLDVDSLLEEEGGPRGRPGLEHQRFSGELGGQILHPKLG